MAPKSKAEISSEDLAAMVDGETKTAVAKAKQGCFGTPLFDAKHDACKACPDCAECAEANNESMVEGATAEALATACEVADCVAEEPAPVEVEVKAETSGVDMSELDALIAAELGDVAGEETVSTDTLDAMVKTEEKVAEASKIESESSGDATVCAEGETPAGEAEAESKSVVESTIDVAEITDPAKAPKKPRKPPKEGSGPKLKAAKIGPVEGPVLPEMLGPHMVLRKHPGIDMNAVAADILKLKPTTTTENAKAIREAMVKHGGTIEAVCNSSYGTARRCLEALVGMGAISVEGKVITWLK